MKLKILCLLISLFTICCKQSKKEISNTSKLTQEKVVESTPNTKEKKETIYNFNDIVKCKKYGYDGTASIGDYGCLYEPKGSNIYGNIVSYLIPKEGIKKHLQKVNDLFQEGDKYDKWEKEGERINNLSIKEIKEEFYIYLSLIDKKYLEHTPNLDASYNIKQSEGKDYKFTTQWFTFNSSIKSWKLLDSFETSLSTDRKAWEWEQGKIKEVIAKNQ